MSLLNTSKNNYCPFCGKKLSNLTRLQLNFCCFCGARLKKSENSLKSGKLCTICHESIDIKKPNIVECSFCESKYHSRCIKSWLLKYNSCPLCLNVFLMPIQIINEKR
ncbi:MAG: RING finger domain-containing protein [Candidatus Thorarchaeota archaeon]